MSDLIRDLIEGELSSKENTTVEVEKLTWLIFTMGKVFYALPTNFVKEILRDSEVFPMPFVPAYVNGVLNRYGDPYGVVDPAILLGNKKQETSLFIVVNDDSRTCFRISEVIDFYSNQASDLRHFAETEQYLDGAFDCNGKEVFILNSAAIIEKVHNELENV